jgi:hypothetical protein
MKRWSPRTWRRHYRRIRGALQPLLKAAPLSKSAVSRVVATLKDGLEAWRTRSVADLDVIYVYLGSRERHPEALRAPKSLSSSAESRRVAGAVAPA